MLIDIDGTICDAQERKFQAYHRCIGFLNSELKKHLPGPITMDLFWKITRAQFAVFPGNAKNDIDIRFSMLLAFLELEKKDYLALLPPLHDIYWEELGRTTLFPGTQELFRYILERGFYYHFFTDTSLEEALFKLECFPPEAFPGEPKVIITDSRPSPDPRVLSIGMDKVPETYRLLKEQAGAVLMIGDSEYFDIRPAKEAGLATLKICKADLATLLGQLRKLKLP